MVVSQDCLRTYASSGSVLANCDNINGPERHSVMYGVQSWSGVLESIFWSRFY